MGPCESTPSTSIHEQPVRCTGRDRSWSHGRAPPAGATASILRIAQARITHGPMLEHPIHEHTRAPCALRGWGSLMGTRESTPSTSIHEHPVRFTGRSRTWAHGRAPNPHAYTSIMCAAQVGIAHGPWESIPSTIIHKHPMRCTGGDRPWSMVEHPIHEHQRASCALQQVGAAHGSMGERPIHEHQQSSYALHRRGSLVGLWENTIHEHPRSSCALQQVGNAHGSMGEYPVNEHTRASRELHRQGLRICPWENTPSTSITEHHMR